MKGFRDFITRGNVIELAIAVVVGTAFTGIVTAVVKDFITPLIGAIWKSSKFETLTFQVHGSTFAYGDLINAVISFFIVSAVVYFLIVRPMALVLQRTAKNVQATERDCPECLSTVPIAASRCKYCTAVIAPAAHV